jgi:transcriptional regulator with XRE-family HTH domain
MERPGEKLKRARQRLTLTYRDVEKASQQIAKRRANVEFSIALSRLADIENKGTVPTIYKIYSLCSIYRLDLHQTLGWYGVPVDLLASEALQIEVPKTHAIHIQPEGMFTVPQPLDSQVDLNQTTFLSHVIRCWGKMGLSFLNGWDLRRHRYGIIGMEDWSMYPLLHPGSLVLIDEGRRRIASGGWTSEIDRPIYFLEHRGGYLCGWCTLLDNWVLVQPHPASQQKPGVFAAAEIDVIGLVAGVAMLLQPKSRRNARSAAITAKPPNP